MESTLSLDLAALRHLTVPQLRDRYAEAFGEHMAREFKRWNAVREAAGIPQQ